MKPWRVAVSCCAFLAAGCVVQGETCEINTSQISMHATAIDGDRGIAVEIELEEGDMTGVATSLELCAEQDERIEVNDRAAELREIFGVFRYVVTFDEPQESYRIEFERPGRGQEIVAEVVAPAQFQIDGPASDETISRRVPVPITWSPAGAAEDLLEIELERRDVLCLDAWSVETEDDGEFTVPAGALVASDPMGPPTCEAEYVITRRTEGSYPAELSPGGEIEAFVKRKLRFTSIP